MSQILDYINRAADNGKKWAIAHPELVKFAFTCSSTVLTYAFDRQFLLDAYTNRRGIAVATLANSLALSILRYLIASFWQYTNTTQEEKNLRILEKEYASKQLQLEKVHRQVKSAKEAKKHAAEQQRLEYLKSKQKSEELDQDLHTANAKLNNAIDRFKEGISKLDELQRSNKELIERLATGHKFNELVHEIKTMISNIELKITDLDAKKKELENNETTYSNEFDNWSTKISENTTLRLKKHKEKNSLEKTIKEIEGSLEKLDKDLKIKSNNKQVAETNKNTAYGELQKAIENYNNAEKEKIKLEGISSEETDFSLENKLFLELDALWTRETDRFKELDRQEEKEQESIKNKNKQFSKNIDDEYQLQVNKLISMKIGLIKEKEKVIVIIETLKKKKREAGKLQEEKRKAEMNVERQSNEVNPNNNNKMATIGSPKISENKGLKPNSNRNRRLEQEKVQGAAKKDSQTVQDTIDIKENDGNNKRESEEDLNFQGEKISETILNNTQETQKASESDSFTENESRSENLEGNFQRVEGSEEEKNISREMFANEEESKRGNPSSNVLSPPKEGRFRSVIKGAANAVASIFSSKKGTQLMEEEKVTDKQLGFYNLLLEKLSEKITLIERQGFKVVATDITEFSINSPSWEDKLYNGTSFEDLSDEMLDVFFEELDMMLSSFIEINKSIEVFASYSILKEIASHLKQGVFTFIQESKSYDKFKDLKVVKEYLKLVSPYQKIVNDKEDCGKKIPLLKKYRDEKDKALIPKRKALAEKKQEKEEQEKKYGTLFSEFLTANYDYELLEAEIKAKKETIASHRQNIQLLELEHKDLENKEKSLEESLYAVKDKLEKIKSNSIEKELEGLQKNKSALNLAIESIGGFKKKKDECDDLTAKFKEAESDAKSKKSIYDEKIGFERRAKVGYVDERASTSKTLDEIQDKKERTSAALAQLRVLQRRSQLLTARIEEYKLRKVLYEQKEEGQPTRWDSVDALSSRDRILEEKLAYLTEKKRSLEYELNSLKKLVARDAVKPQSVPHNQEIRLLEKNLKIYEKKYEIAAKQLERNEIEKKWRMAEKEASEKCRKEIELSFQQEKALILDILKLRSDDEAILTDHSISKILFSYLDLSLQQIIAHRTHHVPENKKENSARNSKVEENHSDSNIEKKTEDMSFKMEIDENKEIKNKKEESEVGTPGFRRMIVDFVTGKETKRSVALDDKNNNNKFKNENKNAKDSKEQNNTEDFTRELKIENINENGKNQVKDKNYSEVFDMLNNDIDKLLKEKNLKKFAHELLDQLKSDTPKIRDKQEPFSYFKEECKRKFNNNQSKRSILEKKIDLINILCKKPVISEDITKYDEELKSYRREKYKIKLKIAETDRWLIAEKTARNLKRIKDISKEPQNSSTFSSLFENNPNIAATLEKISYIIPDLLFYVLLPSYWGNLKKIQFTSFEQQTSDTILKTIWVINSVAHYFLHSIYPRAA